MPQIRVLRQDSSCQQTNHQQDNNSLTTTNPSTNPLSLRDKMASNPLDKDSILEAMAQALPTHEKDDTTSDLSSSLEALSLFTHACMTCLNFRLLGFNEDQKIGKSLEPLPKPAQP
jgi:hypothetical protein